jgi:cytochrome P450
MMMDSALAYEIGPDGPMICVPGSAQGARIYPLWSWRTVLEGLRNPAWRDPGVPTDSALFGPTYQHPHSLLRRQPPNATRLRAVLNPGFSPDSLDRWRPDIRAHAQTLLGGLRQRGGSADLVTGFCDRLVSRAVTVTTGLTAAQWTLLQELTDQANAPILSPSDHEGMQQKQENMRAFYAPVIAKSRTQRAAGRPGQTLVDSAVAALDRTGMPPHEVVTTLQPFLGGFASAIPILTAMTAEALRLPGVLDEIHHDLGLVPSGVREHLRRSCHFLAAQPGVAQIPIEADGRVIPPGSVVMPLIGAAERDPSRTPDPDRYDLHRRRRAVLAFGAGVHHCLGRAWMVLLLEEALRALAQHRPQLAVAPETAQAPAGGLVPGARTKTRIPVMLSGAVRSPAIPIGGPAR